MGDRVRRRVSAVVSCLKEQRIMAQHRSVTIIINPIAGVRPKEGIPALVHRIMPESEGFDVKVFFTRYGGHATQIAQEAVAAGVDTVVAIGGDGTINETARCVVESSTSFGIVPMGSGNGLARHLQLPLDISRALEVIKEDHVESLDYGDVNGHIFFCTAGIGFDAEVSRKFAEMKQRGGLTYLRSAIEVMREFTPQTYEIQTDDEQISRKAFLVAIGNASQWGNNAFITPQASMADGLLDVTLVKPFPLIEVPQMTAQLFGRTIDQNPHVETFRTAHLRLSLPGRQSVHIDGEPIAMEDEIRISIHHEGLRMLTPAKPESSMIEPIRYAFEDVHYSIQNNIRSLGTTVVHDLSKARTTMVEAGNSVVEDIRKLVNPK